MNIELLGRISPKLQNVLARLGALLTYRVAEGELGFLLGIHISWVTIKKCCEILGSKAQEIKPEPPKFTNKEMISMQVDGGKVRTIEDGWREVKVGIVCGEKKKVQMSRITGHNEFMTEYCSFVKDNGYHTHIPDRSFVSDGAKWIGDDFYSWFPKVIQILDFYHFSQHLHETANILFTNDLVKADFWVERIIELAYNNQSKAIIKLLAQEWQKYNLENNRAASESLRKLIQYLKDNEKKILYGEFEEKGYAIGSGKVEATIKTQMEYRMKSASKRWRLFNAKRILTLRDIIFNGQWDKLPRIA